MKYITMLAFSFILLISCGNGFEETSKKRDIVMRTSEVEVQLETASNQNYGAGTFGNPARILTDNMGNNLQFSYDQTLDNIYDENNNGPLISGNFRIVENGRNITEINGLNLTIRAKDLSTIISPPSNECYVDPARGKFVLPKPSYWSKLESVYNIENAEISEETPFSEIEGTTYIDSVEHFQFNVGLFRSNYYHSFDHGSGSYTGYRYIYPNGKKYKDWSKGTISAYMKLGTESGSPFNVIGEGIASIDFIGTTSNLAVKMYSEHKQGGSISNHYLTIHINGVQLPQTYIIGNTWTYHIYIVWNKNKNLSGGKSIIVFLNGTECLSSTENLPEIIATIPLKITLYNYAKGDAVGSWYGYGRGETYLDNLKIWNHVVSEDPNIINIIGNNEELIHPIYGSENNYKPVLDEPGSGVGYYYSN